MSDLTADLALEWRHPIPISMTRVMALHPWLWRHRMERRRVKLCGPRRHGSGGLGFNSGGGGGRSMHHAVDLELGDKSAAILARQDTLAGRLPNVTEAERRQLFGPWASLLDRNQTDS